MSSKFELPGTNPHYTVPKDMGWGEVACGSVFQTATYHSHKISTVLAQTSTLVSRPCTSLNAQYAQALFYCLADTFYLILGTVLLLARFILSSIRLISFPLFFFPAA